MYCLVVSECWSRCVFYFLFFIFFIFIFFFADGAAVMVGDVFVSFYIYVCIYIYITIHITFLHISPALEVEIGGRGRRRLR